MSWKSGGETLLKVAQSVGTAEYTDCTSKEG